MKNSPLFRKQFLRNSICLIVLLGMTNIFAQPRAPKVVAEVDGDEMYELLQPDAIPAIRNPRYISGREAADQMSPGEPVMGLIINGEEMAYSLWQLDTHEIVDDVVGETPIAVSW